MLVDCDSGLEISPLNSKCLQRRAAVYERTKQYQKALDDLALIKGEESDAAQARLQTLLNGGATAPPPRGSGAAAAAAVSPPHQPPHHAGAAAGHSGAPLAARYCATGYIATVVGD